MPSLNLTSMLAFEDELTKEAVSKRWVYEKSQRAVGKLLQKEPKSVGDLVDLGVNRSKVSDFVARNVRRAKNEPYASHRGKRDSAAVGAGDALKKWEGTLRKKAEDKTAGPKELAQSVLGLLGRQAGAAGAGIGAGGALGALGGLGLGAVHGYREARDAGASRGQALTYGLLNRGLGGAVRGGAIGALGGGALGLAGGQKATDLASKLTGNEGILGSVSRFGQRQIHGLTGALPQGHASKAEALKAMGMGSSGAAGRAAETAKGLEKAWQGGSSEELLRAAKEHHGAQRALKSAKDVEEMGLTNLPGYLKSLSKKPLDTLKAGLGEQWHSSGLGGKALMVGLPAMSLAGAVAGPKEHRGENTGKALATNLALGAAPLPLLGSSLLASGAESLGGYGGKMIDKLRSRQPPPPPPADEGPRIAVERNVSNSYLGKAPEGVLT